MFATSHGKEPRVGIGSGIKHLAARAIYKNCIIIKYCDGLRSLFISKGKFRSILSIFNSMK